MFKWLLVIAIVVLGYLWWRHQRQISPRERAAQRPPSALAPGPATPAAMVRCRHLAIYAVETRLYPQLGTRWTLAGLGVPAVLLALLFPGTAYPTLASPWLPLHWALGFASYGLLGAAVAHGWLMQRSEAAIRRGATQPPALPLLALERLTFRFVTGAFVLLTLTLTAGWTFTQLLQPKAGWITHKTVFTALSWAVLAVLLWGRWRWGWRGRTAVRMLYVAGALLLLGYVGSHFVLEVILRRGA